jgi:hypothetical protein
VQLYQLQDDDLWVPVPPIVAPEMKPMTMRLPDIPIPYAASLSANRFRFGEAKDRCLLCGRPVNMKRTRVVLLNDELGGITDPDQDPEYTGGCFDIGLDCWKRHPELHPYEVKGLPKGL